MSAIQYVNNGSIVTPNGFKAAGAHCGLKKKKLDIGMIYSEKPASAAAVYTLNAVQAAPLHITKESIAAEHKLQAVIVNSANANACTGPQGETDARLMRTLTASHLSLPEHLVAVSSTGVIGEVLPMDKIKQGIEQLTVTDDPIAVDQFNQAILTTDTFTKSTCYTATINGQTITLAGSCKGSGMIKPNMATMLSCITTDLNIDATYLQQALNETVNKTFNCVTVDGDTSTNDTVIVMANGCANNAPLTPQSEDWPIFIELLQQVSEDLAKMIAKDGEGATKLIEVVVNHASSTNDAVKIAKSVVGSSLVKTAMYGADANWGRILAAIGYSGVPINPNVIDVAIGDIQMLEAGSPVTFDEETATHYLEQDTIQIYIDVKLGDKSGKAWGCDLTYDYVKINASYRS